MEGLAARDGTLAPIQQAFLDTGAVQCGFCIPGQLVAAHALLEADPHPSRAAIEEGLAGNLCRCACYEQIFEAVELVGERRGAGRRRHARRRRRDRRGRGARRRPVERGGPRPVTVAPGRVGESPNRVGGIGRVTGAQRYLADLHVADALHAALVTLDVARARLGAIDASEALALPGVHLVLTAADLPQPVPRFGPQREDRPVLATGEVHYHGEPVALVVAETRDLAQRAAALVRVEHEPLPAVVTVADALAPDAPLVQDPSLRPGDPLAATNVLAEHRVDWGDLDAEAGARRARRRGLVPLPDGHPVRDRATRVHGRARTTTGSLVWSTIQHPNWLQRVIAGMVGMPLSRVRVIAPDPGGGFGGKQHAKYEPAVVFAALRLGRPVRLVLSLEETFQAVRRAACETHVRIGFDAEGRILFEDIAADYLIGAYTDIADRVVGKGSYPGAGPYNVPAVRILARSILSHTVPVDGVPRLRQPAGQLGRRVDARRGRQARWASTASSSGCGTSRARGDRFIPFDTPCDGDWAQAVRLAAERAGLGRAAPRGPRPRDRRRHQVRPHDRA